MNSTQVKSTAVVKYAASQTPATFAQLKCNTDLNLPPANWLSSSASIYGLQHVLSHSTGFSSFRMAHMFPDCVGEVDVVSDAESIKNLLKLPYSHGQVSMMVHRIENTLLIDEFDIYKHLMRTAENEWEWLRKFFFEHIRNSFSEKDRIMYLKNKSRDALQQKSLVSKFLYYSLVESQDEAGRCEEESCSTTKRESGPVLPEPTLEEEVPDPTTNHKYNRNVVWTLEDIQMLIGTDMPIFGGSTHPCISLRLRDMASPINVLTGIDYWLDNLMSNVPEVVMCYHLNGIVQKYELIKTEDLPNMDNSRFSPSVIRDVAQNILSFLKANATKAGHTYWLFKSKDDDVVKLYDLTSLCTDKSNNGSADGDKDQNPFTIPVAMLLYRVGRNMKHTSGQKHPGTIRMLLKNCIELLPKEKYPQIVTSSHYMISDLYVPANTDPAAPGLESMETDDMESCYEDDLNDADTDDSATKQLRLDKDYQAQNRFVYKPPPPVCGTLEERCIQALNHIVAGLECLQYFPPQEENEELKRKMEQAREDEEVNPRMAKPFQAIPMPYAKLNNNTDNSAQTKKKSEKKANKKRNKAKTVESPNALLPKSNVETMPAWQELNPSDISWNIHLKTLLYEKACLVFATLAEQDYVFENYGRSIQNIRMLVRCHQVLTALKVSSRAVQESCLLGRAGDACFMVVKNWTRVDKYREQLDKISDVQVKIIEQTANECVVEKDFLPEDIIDIEQMLLSSCKCYEKALGLNLVQDMNALYRRLGNVQNELGVFYMNKAGEFAPSFIENYNKASMYLQNGIKSFEAVQDDANLALLNSNMGRLMRVYARYHSLDASGKRKSKAQEKLYYNKALDSYQKALHIIRNRSNNPVIWDTVTWELSSALFTRATLLQDYPTGTQDAERAEREVVETLQQALRYCDMETPGPRQPLYQYRVACIHYRLASLYHSSFRKLAVDDHRRKRTLQLCRVHYNRACTIFKQIEQHSELVKCLLERVAITEFIAQNSSNVPYKIKHLQHCLHLLVEALPSLRWLLSKAGASTPDESKQFVTFANTIEQQVQYALRILAKLCLTKSTHNNNKSTCDIADIYKSLYSFTLKVERSNTVTLLQNLIEVLEKIASSKVQITLSEI